MSVDKLMITKTKSRTRTPKNIKNKMISKGQLAGKYNRRGAKYKKRLAKCTKMPTTS